MSAHPKSGETLRQGCRKYCCANHRSHFECRHRRRQLTGSCTAGEMGYAKDATEGLHVGYVDLMRILITHIRFIVGVESAPQRFIDSRVHCANVMSTRLDLGIVSLILGLKHCIQYESCSVEADQLFQFCACMRLDSTYMCKATSVHTCCVLFLQRQLIFTSLSC